MSGTFRLFRPLLVRAVLPVAVMVWLMSIYNWVVLPVGVDPAYVDPETGAAARPRPWADSYIEMLLMGAAIVLGHTVHRECPRRVMEYLVTQPRSRVDSLAAPLRAASAVLLALSALVLLHEHTGAAWLEVQVLRWVLPIEAMPYHCRPLDPWLTALAVPLAAFWIFTFCIRRWTRRFSLHGGYYGFGVLLFGALVPGVMGGALSVVLDKAGASGGQFLVTGVLLLVTWLAYRATLADLATCPTESYPEGETPWAT